MTTRPRGLSLGDRACRALGPGTGLLAVTAHHLWNDCGLDVTIILICRPGGGQIRRNRFKN